MQKQMIATQEGSMVHALWHGRPLCGFSDRVPRDWPAGHIWTGKDDVNNISCPGCKAEALKLRKGVG
jgi:hypothetical protein